MQFIVKTIRNNDIKNELLKIGFDNAYIDYASLKHSFLTLKIQNLPPHLSTIIKQTALSKGCDAGIHRDVLLNKIEHSDLILSGTIKQLKEIAKNLSDQPFGLKNIAKLIEDEINLYFKKSNPKIMGILNITKDSSSDGGKYFELNDAIIQAERLVQEGADIIDIGAESTRPNAIPVDIDFEIEKLTPVVKELKKQNIKISIDTRNSKTAKKMIELGVDYINDVSGLNYDNKMVDVIKNSDVNYVLCHSKGTPDTMDDMAQYKNIADEIYEELYKKSLFLLEEGIKKERIIIDVGFGFAKNVEQNFELLKRIKEFNSLGFKNLAGVSRKRFIKSLTNENNLETLDELTMLASFYLLEQNVDIIRVHNVKKTKTALDFYRAIYSQKPCL